VVRRQDAGRLCRPRRERAGARVPLLARQPCRSAAGEDVDTGRGATDRLERRAVAGVGGEGWGLTHRAFIWIGKSGT
jgi:hypothetical protein